MVGLLELSDKRSHKLELGWRKWCGREPNCIVVRRVCGGRVIVVKKWCRIVVGDGWGGVRLTGHVGGKSRRVFEVISIG